MSAFDDDDPQCTIMPEECDCCQFKTEELRRYERVRIGRAIHEPVADWLCEFCSTTMASTAYQYPDQFRGQLETLKAICFVGNTVIKRIAEAELRITMMLISDKPSTSPPQPQDHRVTYR